MLFRSPASSPWAFNLVPVAKKANVNTPNAETEWRFVVDFRPLNPMLEQPVRQIAHLGEKLALLKHTVKGMTFRLMSTSDLTRAFQTVIVNAEDREVTAFVTPKGQYQFVRMTYGLATAPNIFHNVVLALEEELEREDSELAKSILTYFDDSIFLSVDFNHLLHQWKAYLTVIERLGLKINPLKCVIGQHELEIGRAHV